MRNVALPALLILLPGFGVAAAAPASGYDLFQKALVKERAEGNLEEAIQLYQRITKEFARDHGLAAKALVQMGQCYEKLGKAEARKAYERVLREFAEERESAAEARARLAALMQPHGSSHGTVMATRQVWAGPEVDVLGGASPDGRYLSYTDWETGDLAVKDLATGEKRRLTKKGTWFDSDEFALFSKISPDGKQVAYDWFNKDRVYDLRVVALSGDAKPRVVYSNEELEYLQPADWSSDGRWILTLLTKKDKTNQLALVSAVDGSVRVIKSLDWRSPATMSLSPDGRYIVYDFQPREDKRERDIFLLATDGSREIPLVEHPANDEAPVWTPDGKRVLFISDRTGHNAAWLIQLVDGRPAGSPEMIKSDLPARSFALGFTRAGAYYYGFTSSLRDVFVATIDVENGRVLSAPAAPSRSFVGTNGAPDWSPDGRYLVYHSRRRTGPQSVFLVVRSVETGEERELLPTLRNLNRSRWSPDGRFLLGMGRDIKGRQGVYRIDVQSGEAVQIVRQEGREYLRLPEWSRDGKAILFVRTIAGQEDRLVARDIESGGETEILRSGDPSHNHINQCAVSPDGKQVAFLAFASRSTTLKVMPISGGEPRELFKVNEPENINGPAWSPDGRYVLLVKNLSDRMDDPTNEIWRIPVAGGQPRKINLTMDHLRGVRIHPDGRRIAFEAGQFKAEVWVMENFLPTLRAGR